MPQPLDKPRCEFFNTWDEQSTAVIALVPEGRRQLFFFWCHKPENQIMYEHNPLYAIELFTRWFEQEIRRVMPPSIVP